MPIPAPPGGDGVVRVLSLNFPRDSPAEELLPLLHSVRWPALKCLSVVDLPGLSGSSLMDPDSMDHAERLQVLVIVGCALGGTLLPSLIRSSLSRLLSPSLKIIDLSGNGLVDQEGVLVLSEIGKSSLNVKSINLSLNNLGQGSFALIGWLASSCPHLQLIDLSSHFDVDKEELDALVNGLEAHQPYPYPFTLRLQDSFVHCQQHAEQRLKRVVDEIII
jgi:hypothetical protein